MEVIRMTKKKIVYYLIRKRILGKKEGDNYFLFKDAEWVNDEKNVIRDRLMGYDPFEPEDSPYAIGSTCVTDGIEEISSAQAKRIISDQTMET